MVNLFKIAALASFLSALTTLLLIYGPNVQAETGVMSQAQLHSNWGYLYRPWVLFFHPQFAFIASLGVAVALFKKRPALISIGLFYLLIWAATEMTQQAHIIDGLNQFWRPGYINAESDIQKQAYSTIIKGFEGISDSLYFVLLFGFGIGTTLFGFAFLSPHFYDKAIGISLIFIGSLSLAAFTGYYTGLSFITPVTSWIYANIYGVVQSGVRVGIGIWLWHIASTRWSEESNA